MRKMKNKDTEFDSAKSCATFSNLSERLVHALKMKEISQAELARQLNIKPQAIHYLCNSRCKKSGFTYQIADILNINSTWLACGQGSMLHETDRQEHNECTTERVTLPILDSAYIKKYAAAGNHPITTVTDKGRYLFTSERENNSGFAWQLQDKSMYPRFDLGTVIIVNPNMEPKSGDYTLIYLHEVDDIIFRIYNISDNHEILLTPINRAMYKPLKKSDDDLLLGVIVEARWQI